MRTMTRTKWTPGHIFANGECSIVTGHGVDGYGCPWRADIRRTGAGWQARFLDDSGKPTGRYSPPLANIDAGKRWVRNWVTA